METEWSALFYLSEERHLSERKKQQYHFSRKKQESKNRSGQILNEVVITKTWTKRRRTKLHYISTQT